jgi:hypothetical protein
MALLKFRAFNKMLKEIKAQKSNQKKLQEYNKIYSEKLKSYNVENPSELSDEQLAEFLESMKTYRLNGRDTITKTDL